MSSGRFPGDGGMVAPGMSCKYSVRFTPDSLGGYEDSVTVEMPMENLLVVPVIAKRPPPVLKCESPTNTCSAAVFMRGLLAAETTVTCCQSLI